jgi:hypothetical protein
MTKIKSEKKIKIKKIKNTVLLSTHIMEQGVFYYWQVIAP